MSKQSDAQFKLAQIKKDYISYQKEIARVREGLSQALSDLHSCENILKKVGDNEELSPEDVRGLSSRLGLAQIDVRNRQLVKLQVKGLVKEAGDRADSLQDELLRLETNLSNLLICPVCNGKGYLLREQRYDRSDDAFVTPTDQQDQCELCSGTGRIPESSLQTQVKS